MTVLAHSDTKGEGRGHPVRAKVFLLLAALMCLLLPGSSVAQTPGSGLLVLSDDSPSVDVAPFVYVTRDDGGKLDLKSVFEKYQQGWRGDLVNGSVIPLGTSGTPYWIVLNVRNDSWTDKWVLSFGQHLTGRIGLLKKIFLYDQISRTTYINNIGSNENPYVGGEGQGSTYVTLNLPRGQSAMFFLYAVPDAGVPATIAPRLMTEAAFAKSLADPLQSTKVMNFFFAAMMGFFIAVIVFHRYWGAVLFLAYYAAQIALFNYLNGTLYSDLAQAGDIVGGLNTCVSVASLLLARSFLDIGRAEYLQNRIIIVVIIANVVAAAAAVLMPHDLFIYPLLMFGPAAATQLFLFLLSMAQGYTGRPAAMLFAMAWLCVLGGTCVSILDAVGILPPVTPMIAGYWLGLAPQGLIMIAAASRRAQLTQADSGRQAMDEADIAEKVAELRQSKEASDNQRLRRLIEHEREVMTELRERESKQNDEMRKAMAAADDANRAKSAFLAVISHEIRTPMSGIMGMVRLLLDSNLPPQQRDYAQTIQDSGDAMLSLLNDILDFEKIESGKMDIEHIDFDLHRLIQGIATLMQGHAANKKVYLKVDLDDRVPRYVIGDPVRMRQVLLNLTGNSIKFTSQGGVTLRVKLEASEEKAMAKQGVHRIRFAVEDTGVGISPEAQKNLFNPFAQADKSTARKFGGTGLGLAISQRLIEAMGGKIRIDSTEGRGSTFYFALAMEGGNAEAAGKNAGGQAVAAQKSEKSLSILIVDDNEINQKLLKEFVDRMGHKTSLAGSGEQCLELMKTQSFEMILMDIELPGLSGMGTTKAIRALVDRKAAATPVIALTGNVREEDIRACFAANMNGHLAKPVDPKRLKTMIDKVIKGTLDNPVQLSEPAQASAGARRPAAPAAAPSPRPVEKPVEPMPPPPVTPPLQAAPPPLSAAPPPPPVSRVETPPLSAAPPSRPAPVHTPDALRAASQEKMDDLLAGRTPPPPPPKAKAPPPLAARAGEPAAIAAAKVAEEMPDPFAHYEEKSKSASGGVQDRTSNKPPAEPAGAPAAIAAAKAAEAMPDPFVQYDKKTPAAAAQDVAPIHALAMSMDDLKPTEEELDADSFAEAIKKGEELEREQRAQEPYEMYEPQPPPAASAPAPAVPAPGASIESSPAAKPANGEIVFDKSVLGDLRNSIDKKSFDDMIRGLLDKADEIVVALNQAAANGDQKAMTARAHELKGMAGNFGLKELSGVAARAEKALKENQTAGLQELLDALPDANMRAREELEKWMAS